MMKFFNTAGPIKQNIHYSVNPLERWNLNEILGLIDSQKYFILHAPRQTGKTSSMLALMDYLNKKGKYLALYANVESAQAARENISEGIKAVLGEIASRMKLHLKSNLLYDSWRKIFDEFGANKSFNELLSFLSENSEKQVVLFLDEVDALIGDTLISLLRQLRSGYDKRPFGFPISVVLCGVRDIRDYRIHSSKEKTIITGGSAFNIKAKSLRIGNFDKDNISELLEQHTKETGQKFEAGIVELFWKYTEGQPWLVNALAYEVTYEIKENRDLGVTITKEHLIQAKENIIQRRDTHLDQLVDKLKEPRVKRIIEPIVATESIEGDLQEDDLQYVEDLGLITIARNGEVKIANQIYTEIIPRVLSWNLQVSLVEKTEWYKEKSGKINMVKLIEAFQQFFRENSETWLQRFDYKEAGPQLLLQAFLQRIINGGGRVEREYLYGSRRTDILVTWPFDNKVQKTIVELKLKYKSLEKTIENGLEQTADYMDKCGTKEGHLIIFDRSINKTWDEKIFSKKHKHKGKEIIVWGM